MADGSARPVTVEAIGDTTRGCTSGSGLYFGLDGHHHGEWEGCANTSTVSTFLDCTDPAVAPRIHQIRDAVDAGPRIRLAGGSGLVQHADDHHG